MAPDRRRLRLIKLRGVQFSGGYHDYAIERGGVVVFPRLIAADHPGTNELAPIPSDIPELDTLLGGGLDRGTSMLIMGPAGCGKTTLAMQYAWAAIQRGEHAALFLFDEHLDTLLKRARGIGMNLQDALRDGKLTVRQVDPAELSPGEFAQEVAKVVREEDAQVVVIDSLNGYLNAMPEERFLTLHMHELLTYLNQQEVLAILVLAQHGMVGRMDTPLDVSYLSDTVLLLRYFEAHGSVHQAISVMKKRSSAHERSIREFRITSKGIKVGEPLKEFQGILTGVPVYTGQGKPAMRNS